MNFQDLHKIEDADTYLDMAFRNARERSDDTKIEAKAKTKALKYKITKQYKGVYTGRKTMNFRLQFEKTVELSRINAVTGNLTGHLQKIVDNFPMVDQLPPFYNELIKATLDYESLKKSLGGMKWAGERMNKLNAFYQSKMARTQDINELKKFRREFYGRVSSVMKQIGPELAYVDEARKTMKGFPNIKTSVKSVCIFGFPNVGKTTLLYKLTGSKAEIKNYAFTTKNINVSYANINDEKIQFIDTPGTLDRKEKINNIELQAQLVLKYAADMIIYVFDPTESYPLPEQIKLYDNLRADIRNTGKKIHTYISKTDISGIAEQKKTEIALLKKKYNAKDSLGGLKGEIAKVLAEVKIIDAQKRKESEEKELSAEEHTQNSEE